MVSVVSATEYSCSCSACVSPIQCSLAKPWPYARANTNSATSPNTGTDPSRHLTVTTDNRTAARRSTATRSLDSTPRARRGAYPAANPNSPSASGENRSPTGRDSSGTSYDTRTHRFSSQ